MSAIKIQHLYKNFKQQEQSIEVLKDISLQIEQGEICGIIGMSGAGKSTLLRCMNYLEQPTSGSVEICGVDMAGLSEKELCVQRMEMGMIFQHFHLLMQKTVLDNVCLPMQIQRKYKKEAAKQAMKRHNVKQYIMERYNAKHHNITAKRRKEERQAIGQRAMELLGLVGLSDKAQCYPASLSGGQKQRVAIARALACEPRILLCDEATSALDPQTTASILQLLKEINETLGITIVMITHQMEVVREICTHAVVIEDGRITQSGTAEDIFLQNATLPKQGSKRQKEECLQGMGRAIHVV